MACQHINHAGVAHSEPRHAIGVTQQAQHQQELHSPAQVPTSAPGPRRSYLGWLNNWQVRSAIGLRGRLLLLLQEGVAVLVALVAGCLLGLLEMVLEGCTGRWWQGSMALARPLAATAFRSCRSESKDLCQVLERLPDSLCRLPASAVKNITDTSLQDRRAMM